jgi:hypothetical protein
LFSWKIRRRPDVTGALVNSSRSQPIRSALSSIPARNGW